MIFNNQPTVGAFYLLPFLIYFILSGVALLQPNYGSQIQQDSSIINQITFSLAYSLAFILLFKQQGVITWVFSRAIPLDILFFLTLISLFWSDFPGKVVILFLHSVGTAFVSFCMAVLLFKDKDKFFRLLLFVMIIYILATIGVTLLRPDIGIMKSSNIYDVTVSGRWRGLTFHPNSLGGICLFVTWVALSNFFHTKNTKWISFLAVITLTGAFYCLYKANSMTSMLLSLALGLGMVWCTFIGNSTGGVKHIKIMLGIFILFVGFMLLYILYPDLISEKYFFRAIGRDSSLSGRSSLWEIGMQGFSDKPYFGWSYDGLRSFLKQNDLGYGQLHNGYLDLLVRGGLVSVFIFGVLLFQLFSGLIKQAFKDHVFIYGLILVVLMHNMTESSILRNPSIIWLMFLVGYFYSLLTNYSRIYQTESN
ncbi:lipid A core - O-antigen ligase [Methyloglobulus morosus KoM1]|uniref:Lipid A core-O-antigen ligase n=1 Tax=Methyloglobulus morosus KoM1 TaxID=1116472 RepID=V5C6N8_9GAMM|nr:O-antigen ligase family protein [Methyloglobulus morosus]ESS74092.1 lipid A core - O-antigen ligase [Methyloglobulus morosus KoM1]